MARRKRNRLRVVVWTLVALTALAVAAYVALTRPARLRAQVLAALRALPVAADVGEVTFSPWDGLQISDLVIEAASPRDDVLGPPLLHIGSASIRCDAHHLLRGRLWPTAVELRDAALVLVCHRDAEDEATDEATEAEWRLVQRLLTAVLDRVPPVAVLQGDVQLLAVERGRSQLVQRLLVRASGQPTADGYHLRVDRRPTGERPLAELRWNRNTGELSASFDRADLRTTARLLPSRAADAIRRLDLCGQAGAERLTFRLGPLAETGQVSGGPKPVWPWLAAAEWRVADGRLALPVEESASLRGEPPTDAFLRFTDVDATLTYQREQPDDPGVVTLDAAGRLRGAPVRLHVRSHAAPLDRLWRSSGTGDPDEHPWSPADIQEAQLHIDGLELPTLESFPAFVRSRQLGGPLAAAFEHYTPRGQVNVRLTLAPATGPAAADLAARLEGEIEACGAACRYYLFPYDCVGMSGRVCLDRGRIRLENLSGLHGGTRLWANGVVNSSRSWSGFDLTFHGRDVALDADLYSALPEEYRQLWQRAAPLGLCDVVTSLRRADGSVDTGAATTDVHVSAHLLAGSLSLGEGPRLEPASGWLTVHGGTVQLRDLHGYQGEAQVELDGAVRVVGELTHADLRVVVADQPVDQRLQVGQGAAGVGLRLMGRADVWGRVWGSERGEGLSQQLTVEFKDGRLDAADPKRPWVVTGGRVHVNGSRREIERLTCRQGDARVDVTGSAPSAAEAGEPLNLELRAQTPTLQEIYPQFVPADWAEVIDNFGLFGPGEITVRLRPTDDSGGVQVQAAEIDVRADRMQPRPMPLDLRNVRARLTLTPGRFRLVEATAECGAAGRLVVRQPREGTLHAGDLQACFDVSAEGLRLEPAFVGAMPPALGQLLETLAGQGEFDAFLPTVRVSGVEPRSWHLKGRVPLRQASLRVGLPLNVTEGELSGTCAVGPAGEVELDALFSIERGQLAGRPIERWSGHVAHRIDDRWVRIDDLYGRLCDGVAQGHLAIDPRTADYELSLKLHDVGAAELLPSPSEHGSRPRRGRIDGDVWLRGRGDDVGSRRGGGSLRIRGASFLQTPVLASVARQRQVRGTADEVDVATLRFLWEGEMIRLRRIDIQSADLRLVGEGTWNPRSDAVQMTLWGAHPEHWPRIAVLTDLLESAGQELVQYRVEGTLTTPKVTAEPLHRLSEALRRLLGEEER